MTPAQQRNLVIGLGGGAIVLIIALVAALTMGRSGPTQGPQPVTAASNGLQVELGKAARLDPNAQLRCFVGGKYVGMETTAECAAKNGVAPGALDVGVDQSGAPAAATAGAVDLKPLPVAPQPAPPVTTAQTPDTATPPPASSDSGSGGDCMRFTGRGWRSAGSMPLGACVRTLFAGRCLDQGEAIYGRWGPQTLRLVPGRVEMSPDNRSFHPLVDQEPDCSFPPA